LSTLLRRIAHDGWNLINIPLITRRQSRFLFKLSPASLLKIPLAPLPVLALVLPSVYCYLFIDHFRFLARREDETFCLMPMACLKNGSWRTCSAASKSLLPLTTRPS
jgi:hypothetical protein